MTISNRDDIIDSLEIIDRIAELEAERDAAENEGEAPFDEDSAAELAELTELAREGEGYSRDWAYGVQLIRESYFEDYARELADDLHGRAMQNAHWPFDCIDWDKAASELRQDYTGIEYGGVTYYVR